MRLRVSESNTILEVTMTSSWLEANIDSGSHARYTILAFSRHWPLKAPFFTNALGYLVRVLFVPSKDKATKGEILLEHSTPAQLRSHTCGVHFQVREAFENTL